MRGLLLLALMGQLLMTSGCTRGGLNSPRTYKPGQFVFAFDLTEIIELSITKNDPETGDRWSAELAHVPSKTKYEDPTWEILSRSQEGKFLDNQADANLVNHLLDTLKTLQFSSQATLGPLTSFGLDPPRFALRWRTPNHSFELRMGDAVQGSESVFYGQISSESGLIQATPIVLKGSAQKLLGYISNFSKIRRLTLSMLTSDDVDEFLLKRQGKIMLFAQRDGDLWTDKKHRTIRKIEVGKLLDQLTHIRIKDFVDESNLAREIGEAIQKSPAFEAVLTPRKGEAKVIRLSWFKPKQSKESKLWMTDSGRNSAVFEAYPEIIHFFEVPEKQ